MGSSAAAARSFHPAVDRNRDSRRRYWGPRLPRRTRVRIKAGRVLVVLAVLTVGLMKVAYGGEKTGTAEVTVQSGQTLWTIAGLRYPDDDVRRRVADIVQLNHLEGQVIYPGERLKVPSR